MPYVIFNSSTREVIYLTKDEDSADAHELCRSLKKESGSKAWVYLPKKDFEERKDRLFNYSKENNKPQ